MATRDRVADNQRVKSRGERKRRAAKPAAPPLAPERRWTAAARIFARAARRVAAQDAERGPESANAPSPSAGGGS